MVLESTMICVDNSDYMRNGDFLPSRFQAQQDAVNLICHSKTRSNPENQVGLLSLANTQVLVTLTNDAGRLLAKLHSIQPYGAPNFVTGIRIAHLALKHRQSRNHQLRMVIFVGSPIREDIKELEKLAKRLKKENVNVDVINFGEEETNTEKLNSFVDILNKDNKGGVSHLVTVPPGPLLSDALLTSTIIRGEDGSGAIPSGSGFEFGIDPNEDPELALALRVSMEEQRHRQEDETRRVTTESAREAGMPEIAEDSSEDALLKQALQMSQGALISSEPDYSMMTEEEQIAYAMQMSLAQSQSETGTESQPMDTDDASEASAEKSTIKDADLKEEPEEDYAELMSDPAFLQSVLEDLPGVDPQSEEIKNAMSALTKKSDDKKGNDSTKKGGKK